MSGMDAMGWTGAVVGFVGGLYAVAGCVLAIRDQRRLARQGVEFPQARERPSEREQRARLERALRTGADDAELLVLRRYATNLRAQRYQAMLWAALLLLQIGPFLMAPGGARAALVVVAVLLFVPGVTRVGRNLRIGTAFLRRCPSDQLGALPAG
ncbi:hypothetical protein J2S57_006124 [Kineosporia succinea]|uniref:Uncharacterized protein n=2 Tax=Kineosporia succinea TaxID=84632 RepID=A0ABT9PEG7_9ACTN|nr:hypothetical protein [Kineosporia succinea]